MIKKILKSKIMTLFLVMAFGFGLILTPKTVLAQTNSSASSGSDGSTSGKTKTSTISPVAVPAPPGSIGSTSPDLSGPNLNNGLNKVLTWIGVLAVGMLTYSGFMYITAGGEAEKIKKAKNSIMFSITGLIIIVLAFAIVNFVLRVVK